MKEVFFTRKGDVLYAIVPTWPEETLVLEGVTVSSATEVILLGTDRMLKWQETPGGMRIDVPTLSAEEVSSPYAHVFKITSVL